MTGLSGAKLNSIGFVINFTEASLLTVPKRTTAKISLSFHCVSLYSAQLGVSKSFLALSSRQTAYSLLLFLLKNGASGSMHKFYFTDKDSFCFFSKRGAMSSTDRRQGFNDGIIEGRFKQSASRQKQDLFDQWLPKQGNFRIRQRWNFCRFFIYLNEARSKVFLHTTACSL